FNKKYESYEYEKYYVDYTEAMVGSPGIAEEVPGWSGRSGAWYIVHQAALERLLPGKKIIWDIELDPDSLIQALQFSPVVYGTIEIGNLAGGHIILVLGYDKDKDEFIVHDPFGDATTNYKDTNGAYKRYPRWYLRRYFSGHAIYSAPKVFGIAGKSGVKKKLFHLQDLPLQESESISSTSL
ncbi:MAG TPA: papain-like cysteine protease family protein, partial [Leptospiraceae bacterium]|nr:papain-like cysteine protease family protein [Leptospiraceae bacterium]